MFWRISLRTVLSGTQTVFPVVSVWHVQGTTATFCWQPRNSWSQVWFTHQNWFRFHRKDWVRGSVSEARPALNTIWRRNPCVFCQETRAFTSAATMRSATSG